MASIIEQIDRYPYKLGSFGNGLKYLILEDDYYLYFGKRRKEDGSYELYAKVTTRYYPHDIIPNGEKVNIKIYKQDGLPSASWALDTKNKTIYLFLSKTTSYVNDTPTLPEDILKDFDSSDVDLSMGLMQNQDNIYGIIKEIGAFFAPTEAYRQFAIVRSALTGDLYQKKTIGESIPSDEQKDPYLDPTNWIKIGGSSGSDSGGSSNSNLYVDIQSSQEITGQKTFAGGIYKGSITSNPNSLEILCRKEAENIFLKIGDTSENSRKLMNYSPSEIGGANINKSVIVVTNNNGKIDDSFLNATIASTDRNLKVDPSKADNVTTFATIQEAWDAASKMIILGNVTINVADGIYTKSTGYPVLNFTNIYDASKISIIGNINNPENCIIRTSNAQMGLYFTGRGLFINGFTFRQQETERGTSIGINLDSNANMICGKSIIVDNFNIGVSTSENSYIDADYLQATNCNTGFYADASVMNINYSKAQSCYNGCIADNRSVIYAKGSIFNKGNIQSTNTIGYKSIYGSIIRAQETVGSSDMDKQYDGMESNKPNDTLGIIEYT